MNNLIIDAASDKIFFTIMADNKSYTSEFINNRENFDKLTILIVKFLENHELNIKNIDNIFVNQGPGKFSGVRASLATAKALSFVNKIDLYGFNSNQIINGNYVEIIDLFNKGLLIKNCQNNVRSPRPS
jgi:tRNA threonylcarbamoyladenosine biosynthesis protein TsaB